MLYTVIFILLLIVVLLSSKINWGGYYNDYLSLVNTKREKGVAGLLILFHHISQHIQLEGVFTIPRYIGFVLVAYFFFISGYGLSWGIKNKNNYLKLFFKKRIYIVLLPYWIMLTVYLLTKISLGYKYSISSVVLSVFGFDRIVSCWFVASIVIMYSIFWLSEKTKKRNMLLLMIVAYIVICTEVGLHSSYTASVAAFYLGLRWERLEKTLLSFFRKNYWIKLLIIGILFLFLFVGRLYIMSKGVENVYFQIIYRNIISILFIIFIVCLTQKVVIKGRIFDVLGNISYELYLVQGIMISALLQIHLSDSIYIIVEIIVCIISAIVLNAMSSWIKSRLISIPKDN